VHGSGASNVRPIGRFGTTKIDALEAAKRDPPILNMPLCVSIPHFLQKFSVHEGMCGLFFRFSRESKRGSLTRACAAPIILPRSGLLQETQMDLHELYARTGIEPRKLRYCLDHELIPDLHIDYTPNETGQPRKFHEDVGFGIVCAAELLKIGLPHATIRRFLRGLLDLRISANGCETSALLAVLERPARAIAHLGDSVNVRIVVDAYDYNSGWYGPALDGPPVPLPRDYAPVVIVTLDIGKIRDLVFTPRAAP
jgi:hypothetical protein